MDIIEPLTIADAQFVSSNVTEADFPVWSAATTYALGAKVILTAGAHRIYESLQASNLNHDPKTRTAYWLDVGPTNRWAMLDDRVGTATSRADSIVLTLQPGAISALAFLEVEADNILVEQLNGATVVYSKTYSMSVGSVYDWWTYFFAPVGQKRFLILTDLINSGSYQLRVTINNPGATAKCGVMVLGSMFNVGELEDEPRVRIVDYSTKENDTFGNPNIIERAFSKKMTVNVWMTNAQVDTVAAKIPKYRARPVLWVGSTDYDSLVVYGFWKDFELLIRNFRGSICSLDIEGLI